MANSLYPAFVRLFWHSAQAPHVKTIPTLGWTEAGGTNGKGVFTTWNSSVVDAQDMIEELVGSLADFNTASSVYDSFIIYTMSAPDAIPQPRAQGLLGVAGTSVGDAQPASQGTYTWRTTNFGIFKLEFLDAPVNDNFAKITVEGTSGQPHEVSLILRDSDNGWAGRDGGQVTAFLQASFTLNEKLRKSYRLN